MKASRPHLWALVAISSLGTSCVVSSDGGGFSIEIGSSTWDTHHRASEERRLELDLRQGDVLIVEDIHGDVTLRAQDGPSELQAELIATGETKEQAEEALTQIDLRVERSDQRVTVIVDSEPLEIQMDNGARLRLTPTCNLTLAVPPGIGVRVESASGQVDLVGPLGETHAETGFGDVSVSHVQGAVTATSDSGDLDIRDIQGGAVTAETSFGDVTLEKVVGTTVQATSSSGDLELHSVQGARIVARSSFGSIELEAVGGDVEAETASGDVELEGAKEGTHSLHSGFGRVTVEQATGTLQASSDSGDVVIEDIRGSVQASSEFGSVTVEGILSQLAAEAGSGDVAVVAQAGSRVAGGWSVTSSFGEIRVRLPEGIACKLEASTDFGEIDRDGKIGGSIQSEGGGQVLRATLGQGGNPLRIYTSSGDIELDVDEN